MNTTRNDPERQHVTRQEPGQCTDRDQHRADHANAWNSDPRSTTSGGGR
jgi:hypothetical protein